MSSSNCCFLTCIQVFQEAGQVVWYSHLFQNFPQFIVIHTVKGFGTVNKSEIDVFLELSCFFDCCCRCSATKSCPRDFATLWTAAHQVPLSSTISQSLFKFLSIESVMLSNHFILCHSLLLWPSVFPSIRVFSNESVLPIRWPKYWSFSIGPSNEHSGLISCRIHWFDLLAVQGTLKSLLWHHSSKGSILWCSAFLMVQLSHPYDYWKNHSFD